MSDIQSLISRIQELQRSFNSWNNAYLTVAGIAITLGLIAFFLQYVASKKSISLVAAQSALSEAKDKQAAIDSQEKDLKIAGLEDGTARLTADNLRLKAAIEPRRLSDRQEKALVGLSKFANHTVGVRSYSTDTEGLILGIEILEALKKSKLAVQNNLLTIIPANSVTFGVSIDGTNKDLVWELKKILSEDGNLMMASSIALPNRPGFSARVTVGESRSMMPLEAVITVGPKPIKRK
jgi:hypothetical protein